MRAVSRGCAVPVRSVARIPVVWRLRLSTSAAMAAMLAHIGDGRVADGLVEAIAKVGTVLAAHFPRQADDINELPDRLIEV